MDEFEVTDSDAIRAILDFYFGGRRGTGGDAARRDEEYYEDLPNELQWLEEDKEVFRNLANQYLNKEITWEELQEFQIGDYGDYGSSFVDNYNATMSLFEAEEIISALETNPERLNDPVFQELQFPQTEQIITDSAFSFAGTTPTTPITTVGDRFVIRGGAGAVISMEDILNSVGFEDFLGSMVPYIPGIPIPDWLPTAGVIFFPKIQEGIDTVREIIKETKIEEAIEEGDLGEIIKDIGSIVVGAGGAAAETVANKVKEIYGKILGTVTDPTKAGGILGSVIGNSFPNIPSWLPPLILDPRVYGAVKSVLTSNFSTPEEQFPPLDSEIDQDPALMFTHRGDNYFVNKTEDEYFQLADSEDFDFELNGQYTREQLENTGLDTINSGTYQSLLGDLSFHALEEDIYQYSMDDLIARYEEEGGILPGDWKEMDEESRYNYFLDDYFDIPTRVEDPDRGEGPDTDTDTDTDTGDVTSVVEGLFADFLEQLDTEFTGQQDQINSIINNFVQTLPDFDAMPTMEDIAEYFEVNGVTLSQQNFDRIREELANAGYLTQEQLTEALAGVATSEQVQQAIEGAGFATPEQVIQALAEAGYATPDDITAALNNSGFVTDDRMLQALAEAGYATPEQVEQIVNNAVSNIVIPEGATTEEVRQLIQEAINGIPAGISLDDVSGVVNEAIANIDFPEGLSGEDVRGIVDSFGFATSSDVQANFDDLNDRFDDAINGIATQFSDQEAEFLASITGLEASLIQSLAAVEGGLSTELEMLDQDLVSLREDVAGRFDEFQDFTSQQFELAANERRDLQQAIIAANGDITQLSLNMQQQFADFGGTITDLFAGVGVDIAALQAGQITQEEALDQLRTSLSEQLTTASEERQELLQAIISVGGDVTQLSEDMMTRFQQQDQTIEELFAGTNVNIEALLQGQISQAEAFDAYQQYTAEQFGLAQQDRLQIAQEIISVGGQVENLSEESQQRFNELNLSLSDLQEEFNVNLLGLQQGQISQAEAFGQFRDSVTTRLTLGEEQREEILTRQADFERLYGEQQEELQEQIIGGNILNALAAGGMFGGAPSAPAPAPFKGFMKELEYSPLQVPELAIKTPALDYNEESQKLLKRIRPSGMLTDTGRVA